TMEPWRPPLSSRRRVAAPFSSLLRPLKAECNLPERSCSSRYPIPMKQRLPAVCSLTLTARQHTTNLQAHAQQSKSIKGPKLASSPISLWCSRLIRPFRGQDHIHPSRIPARRDSHTLSQARP